MDSVVAYGLDKLVKYATDGVSFGSFIVAYSINQSVWEKLPDDVKKAMDAASEAITPKACADVDKEQDATRQKMKDGGIGFTALPDATRAEMKEKLKGVAQEWAAGLDSRGKQASATLKEFDGLLAAGGAK
jgi:TRAP-type C4-dicarboxylate transport system substrate-binding protein